MSRESKRLLVVLGVMVLLYTITHVKRLLSVNQTRRVQQLSLVRTQDIQLDRPLDPKACKIAVAQEVREFQRNHPVMGKRSVTDDVRYRKCTFRDPPGIRTALASSPGSGNTWTRHLLEELTGIYTGSRYRPPQMVEDFPGEGIRNGSVIVIKTHSPPDRFPVDQAILLVRNPYRALLSEANRIAATQTGHVNQELFTTEVWQRFVRCKIEVWRIFHEDWLQYDGPLLMLRYEDVSANLEYYLHKMSDFLQLNITQEDFQTTIRNSEGAYHRSHSDVNIMDIYDKQQQSIINDTVQRIDKIIHARFG